MTLKLMSAFSHLIADHLGWFKDATGGGRTIEDFMKEKGVTVKRGHIDPNGTVTEYAPE
jgi:protein import protein ZIM17